MNNVQISTLNESSLNICFLKKSSSRIRMSSKFPIIETVLDPADQVLVNRSYAPIQLQCTTGIMTYRNRSKGAINTHDMNHTQYKTGSKLRFFEHVVLLPLSINNYTYGIENTPKSKVQHKNSDICKKVKGQLREVCICTSSQTRTQLVIGMWAYNCDVRNV